ncbi:hypothetical protein LTR48_000410 [Friedmanniomyces endolithicus]|uniref:BHLH domain-containing protein n=1 Tax=Rachicladosporium monterosium TaxID=1507873 RepID=A0ABR0LI32_9PEZI|nr:hypothetical protein LTR29_009385 [Friedmanniomyces endolithicus]KAK1094421.1 hypothetical protein LTR48_000410 [Friedmanniomyces endolithicus]KAK5148504.1 hypothetical protein LTR32_000231 [Rachicladosporium monterosium]
MRGPTEASTRATLSRAQLVDHTQAHTQAHHGHSALPNATTAKYPISQPPARPHPLFLSHSSLSPTTASYTTHLFSARRPGPETPTTSKTAIENTTATTIMPRPVPPPTPGSSSDLRGKEPSGGSITAPAFNLPPTAYQEPDRLSNSSSTPSVNGSDSSYRPVSPPSPADLSRKRPATMQSGPAVITKDDFALPPPPTRSRKIIQMKPKDSSGGAQQQQALPAAAQTAITSPPAVGRTPSTASQAGGKRKQNNTGATAAGRKIARKTAHSLIERRRRSKMNEEFGVLKDMIPACKGQEMHKLAILQASIEYLRYLEQCVTDLQAQNNSPRPQPPPLRVNRGTTNEDDEDEDEDEDMADDNADDDNDANEATASSTPATSALEPSGSSAISLPSLAQLTTTLSNSPATFGPSAGASGRHYSISSQSQASYSPYFHSTHTSPAFGPQPSNSSSHSYAGLPAYGGPFGLGSPALRPMDSAGGVMQQQQSQSLRMMAEGGMELAEKQRAGGTGRGNGGSGRKSDPDLDREAAAALSMLNHDRRGWRAAGTGSSAVVGDGAAGVGGVGGSTGMSVKDLLSG